MSTVETPAGLGARAPRPPVVRLRRGAALAILLGACALVAGALSWSFILAPQLRAAARASAAQAPKEAAAGKARPSEFVASQPASYDRLAAADLPPPRILGDPPPAPVKPARRPAPSSAGRPLAASVDAASTEASRSGLFFARTERSASRARAPGGPESGAPVSGGPAPLDSAAAGAAGRLAAGTLLPASLLTAIDTVRPGPVLAVVTSNVYDSDEGRRLLVPQGARLLGRTDGASRHGEARAFVTWERLTLPGGASYALESEPGVDALGTIGVPGRLDRRLGQLSVATLFAAAITTLGQLARDEDDGDGGLLGDVGDAAAMEAARIGGRLIDRELQVAPSIRLAPGASVHVLLTRDLSLPVIAP